MRRRANAHPSDNDRRHGGPRRWLAFTGAVIALAAGMTTLATSASAHDAPPSGSASCQSYGPSYNWQVTDGSTFVENAAGSDWEITFASSAGTITPAGPVTGSNDTNTGPSFTVTGIPSSVASITVTSTLKWGTAPNYTGGTDTHQTTIARPAGGCDQSVPVPGAPTVTPPTCFAVGSLAIPADTASVTWSVTPAYHAGDTGPFTVTATTTPGHYFDGGATTATYPVTVLDKVTGAACDTVVAPVAPSVVQSVCNGPGTNTSATLTIPTTTGVIYKIAGSVVSGVLTEVPGTSVTVVATPAAGFKFAGGVPSIDTVVSFDAAPDCSVSATPVTPNVSEIACNGPGSDAKSTLAVPTTTGVIYTINGVAVSGSIDETGAGPVVVKAAPAPGYFFDKSATTSWTFSFTPVDCTGLAHVVQPGFVDAECVGVSTPSNAIYSIPSTKNVTYRANGAVVSAGSHKVVAGSTITVTATADKGYELDTSKSSWTHTFSAAPVCRGTDAEHVARPQTTPTTPTALASTGVPTQALLVGGVVIVLLGIGLLMAGGVRGRKDRV
jgi:hypothetical protein